MPRKTDLAFAVLESKAGGSKFFKVVGHMKWTEVLPYFECKTNYFLHKKGDDFGQKFKGIIPDE